MAAGISLNSSVRSSLLSLQDTASLQATTQNHLSTGKKVASALDNPINFFTAASLNDRSNALSGLLDGISNGVQTIQAASKGIDGITKLVQSLQSTITQAQNDAAANRPTKTGTALSVAAEATATGKGLKDTTLAKKLGGADTTADAATASASGDIGIDTSTNTALAFTINAGSTTYTATFTGTQTVQDLVNGINASGIATASVDDSGKLTVTGTGSNTLKIGFGSGATAAAATTDSQSGTLNAKLGLAATDYTTGVTSSGNSTVRSNLVKQFNDLTTQLDQLARDSGYNGKNLLGGDTLSVVFNEKTGSAQSSLSVQGTTLSSASLGIGQAANGTGGPAGSFNIQDDTALSTAKDTLTNALTSLRSLASTFGSSLSTVQTRQDFTKQLSNVLTTGADNLTNADLNFEAANYTALQTRQSIAQQTLGLANQANQGVLQLLR
ncbi:flagellin [Methylobacterium durans]|uniref:Flagellin n=1 Tax=Methylobacterium durans TaxID=2202825 RepID=A0A2U8W7G6_9HYPH|nr:flagellin [Methylobacterium durans]AWN42044.1 flagellin [Methylobacterium durans]